MGKVYRLGGANQTIYCNTRRQADGARPDGEQSMSFDVFDAATHCRDLCQQNHDLEQEVNRLRCLLTDLYDAGDGRLRGSRAGVEVGRVITDFDRSAAESMGIVPHEVGTPKRKKA